MEGVNYIIKRLDALSSQVGNTTIPVNLLLMETSICIIQLYTDYNFSGSEIETLLRANNFLIYPFLVKSESLGYIALSLRNNVPVEYCLRVYIGPTREAFIAKELTPHGVTYEENLQLLDKEDWGLILAGSK